MQCSLPAVMCRQNNIKKSLKKILKSGTDEGEYLGMFLCQGNVESDRRKIMISQMPSKEKEMQQMFRLGNTHPDEEDLENAVDFAIKIQAEIGD